MWIGSSSQRPCLNVIPELKLVYRLFDYNKDGFISLKEIKQVMKMLKLSADEDKIQELFNQIDKDGKDCFSHY